MKRAFFTTLAATALFTVPAAADVATISNDVAMSCTVNTCTFQSAAGVPRACAYTVEYRLVSGVIEQRSGAVSLGPRGYQAVGYRPGGWSLSDTPVRAELQCSGP